MVDVREMHVNRAISDQSGLVPITEPESSFLKSALSTAGLCVRLLKRVENGARLWLMGLFEPCHWWIPIRHGNRTPQKKLGTGFVACTHFKAQIPDRLGDIAMLSWALVFLIIALIAGALGFGVVSGTAASIAKVLFLVFLVLFIVGLITGRRGPVA